MSRFSPIFLVLSAGLILTGCQPAKPEPTAAVPVPVITSTVHPGPMVEEIAVSGLMTSETEARLSFKTGGLIQKILVKEGDSVSAGSLLASLNLTEISAQVEQAEEALTKAERDLKRVKALFATSVATQEQVDNAETGYQVAVRTREIARYNRTFSEIRASGPGVVVKKLMNEGEMAGPGVPVLLISGSAARDWVLRCRLSDVQWAKTALGDKAFFSIDAYPGTGWVGAVSRRASGADPGTGLYDVDIQVQPGSRALATGLFAKGHLLVKADVETWEVPTQALTDVHGQAGRLYVLEQNRPRVLAVTVVRWVRDSVLVTGDLNPSSRVVVAGAPYLTLASEAREVSLK